MRGASCCWAVIASWAHSAGRLIEGGSVAGIASYGEARGARAVVAAGAISADCGAAILDPILATRADLLVLGVHLRAGVASRTVGAFRLPIERVFALGTNQGLFIDRGAVETGGASEARS